MRQRQVISSRISHKVWSLMRPSESNLSGPNFAFFFSFSFPTFSPPFFGLSNPVSVSCLFSLPPSSIHADLPFPRSSPPPHTAANCRADSLHERMRARASYASTVYAAFRECTSHCLVGNAHGQPSLLNSRAQKLSLSR